MPLALARTRQAGEHALRTAAFGPSMGRDGRRSGKLHGGNGVTMEQAEPDGGQAPAQGPRALQREPVLLHMPVDVRSLALVVIAVLLTVFALQWARAVVVPTLMGVMMSYALTPAVDLLQRARLPRPFAAGVVMSAVVAALAWGTWSLSDQANALVESLPGVAQKVRRLALQDDPGAPSAIARMKQAAAELEQAVQDPGGAPPQAPSQPAPAPRAPTRKAQAVQAPKEPTQVVIVNPGVSLRDYLWTGTLGAAQVLGQAVVVFSIALFLLASGDAFRRKLVKLAGPTLGRKKITVQVLNEITGHIQRYLLVQVAVSLIVGVLTGLSFYALGVEQASVWGVVAGVTNLIPYVGAAVTGLGSALVVATQFGALDMGLWAAALSFGIHAVVGNILTPWWMGRTSRISPIAVFLSLLVFGWMWGVPGLLLGVPVLMVTKSICDRVEDLQPVGELLGE